MWRRRRWDEYDEARTLALAADDQGDLPRAKPTVMLRAGAKWIASHHSPAVPPAI
jgi:hypothetical protein